MSCHSLLTPLESLDYLDWVSTLKPTEEQLGSQTPSTIKINEKACLIFDSLERKQLESQIKVSPAKFSQFVENSSNEQTFALQHIKQPNSQFGISSLQSSRLTIPLLKFCDCPTAFLEVFVIFIYFF